MERVKALSKKKLAALIIVIFLAVWVTLAYRSYSNQILMVNIEGYIADFQETSSALYSGENNRNVKAIVLFLNTPGGGAYPSMEIAHSINETKRVKPVVASMGALCASGGYYIASFADYVFTHKNTLTGAIGVISVWPDYTGYYEDQGIKIHVWKTGSEKDLGASWRSPTETENASIRKEVDRIFLEVLDSIQKNRNLTDEIIDTINGGGIYSGVKAVEELNLADEIGNIEDSKIKALEMAGLTDALIVTPEMSDWERFLSALF